MTSQHGGLEISSRGFELVGKSVVFRVFPAVFARLLVMQQRRGNGRRLVHKMRNNGFEMLEKRDLSSDVRVNFACYFHGRINLEYLSKKNFQVLKNPLDTLEVLWLFDVKRGDGPHFW